MQALSAPQRLGAVLALVGVLAAAPAAGQVFRCEEGGRIVYSDKPCPGNGRTIEVGPGRGANRTPAATPPRALTAAEELARKCTAGNAAACRTQKTLQQFDRQRAAAQRLCAGGERAACDLIDCADKNDRAACARAEERSTEAGWTETARRIEMRPARGNDGGAAGDRVTVINVRCDYGGAPLIEIGNTGVRVAGQPARFESLDAAARHACGTDL